MRIVARLPTSVAGPPRLTTSSEVATINYRGLKMPSQVVRWLSLILIPVQSHTTVPIPKILDWSDDSSNAIGSEYIIMEHAVGIQLHQKWPMMSGRQQIDCIQAISMSIQQMAAIEFPAYGSLYFANMHIEPQSKVAISKDYCIGPHCGPRYWDCNVGEARDYVSINPNSGPCTFFLPAAMILPLTGLCRVYSPGVLQRTY